MRAWVVRRDRGGTERGEEIGHWRRKVEDKESVTFFFFGWCWCAGITPHVEPELSYLSLRRWQAVCLDGGVKQEAGGSEWMLRTLKVSDSERGLGSRGDIVIYWLLGGSSWPEFEVTVRATANGNFRALIFTLAQTVQRTLCKYNSRPIIIYVILTISNTLTIFLKKGVVTGLRELTMD